jgi:hypothetical protein
MSDYLTRLGARALGVANAVRPALAPMFASAPAVLIGTTLDEELPDGPDAARPPEPNEELFFDPSVPRARQQPSKPRLFRAENQPAPPSAVDLADAPAPGVSAPGLADTSRNDDGTRVPRPRLPDSPRDRNEGAVEALEPEPRVASREPVDAGTRLPTAVPTVTALEGAARRHTAQTTLPALALRLEDDDSETPPAPTNLPAVDARVELPREGRSDAAARLEHRQRRVVPVATHAARQHDARPQPALDSDARRQFARLSALGDITRAQPENPRPPIVRVSIGRIEVRAAPARPPAAPPAPRAPARPSVTLARYLARKRGDPT